MKELYLLRHAIAAERAKGDSKEDARRPLTPKGERKMRRIAEAMRRMELAFDLILSSPSRRARQTAEIVADEFKLRDCLTFSGHLSPEGDSEDLVHELKRLYHQPNAVLLVGHEPNLSALISTLLSGRSLVDLTLKKGGLCLLTLGRLDYGRCAKLEWLLTPRQLMRMR